MEETYLIRLLDSGDFNNSNELIDHIRNNNYKAFVAHITPFVELEVTEDEYDYILTILNDHEVAYRIF